MKKPALFSAAALVRSASGAELRQRLEEGLSPAAPLPENGYTPLQWAARHGNNEAIKTLRDHGAYINQALDVPHPKGANLPPLYHALANGQAMAARALVAIGADVHAKDHNSTGQSALAMGRAAKWRLRPWLMRGRMSTQKMPMGKPLSWKRRAVGTVTWHLCC